MKKPWLIGGTLATVALVMGGASLTFAQSSSATSNNLVNEIAQHFNLNKADVQKVVDQHTEEQQAERTQKIQERLDALVKKGTLTADQEAKIIAEQKDISTFRASLKGKSAAERKAALATEKTQVEVWAKNANIPVKYLLPGLGGMAGRHLAK